MIQPHDSLVVQTLTRVLTPVIQLYGLYVLFFGQYGPGGGFVGGVIIGTSLILAVLVFGSVGFQDDLASTVLRGDGIGLLIFCGVGGLCLIGAGEFLNYADMELPGLDTPSRRYIGILLTQIGVAVDVAVTAVSIVYSFLPEDEGDGRHA